jgi:class 3 adenylate cyclase
MQGRPPVPIFLDRHDMVEQTAEETARLHVKDLEIQGEYGVKFLTYWYDADRRTTFCLVDAPDKATADRVHSEAHGHVANEMIEVDIAAVEAFLGRVQDPPSAKDGVISDSAFRAIMFTDIAGSTELTARIGDAKAVELLRAHDAIIRRCLERHGGVEVKHLGDGVMASFRDPPAAVIGALDIQRELAMFNIGREHPVRVRIGLHAGEPVEDSNDLFGAAVQKAARICAAAGPDEILASGDLRDACPGLAFASVGSETLKGFSDPVQIFIPTGSP